MVSVLVAFAFLMAQMHVAFAAITNDAVATATYNSAPVNSTTSSQSVPVVTAAPGILLGYTGVLNDDDGTPGLSAGDSISYSFTAENTGNISLTTIGVSDPNITLSYLSGDTDGDGEIDPNETWTYNGSYTIQQPDLDNNGGGDGDIDALATLTSTQLPDQSLAEEVSINPVTSMAVTYTGTLNDDDGTPGQSDGDTISYQVSVENSGNVTLTNIGVSDPDVTLTYQSGDANSDGELDAGETWIYTGSKVLQQSDLDTNGGGDGDIDTSVTVSSTELADQFVPEEVAITPLATLSIAKSGTLNDDDGNVGVTDGDTIDYVITVQNTGNVTHTNPVLTDVLDQSGTSTTLSATLNSGDTNSDGEIDVGETWIYRVSHTLTQAQIDNGNDLINTATIVTDQSPAQNGADTVGLGAGVERYTMAKTASLADGDGDNLGDIGEVITYTFRFTNTGTKTLANLAVIDTLAGLSAISCAGDGDTDGDIDLLAPLGSADCTATYTIGQPDINAGSVLNSATSSATLIDGVTPVVEDDASGDNTVSVATDRVIALAINKAIVYANSVLPSVYEIQYRLTLTNNGTAALTNLTLNDGLASAVQAPGFVVQSGAISGFTGFSGTGSLNGSYDGMSNTQLFSGDVQLAPGATGELLLTFRASGGSQSLSVMNTATANSTELTSPVLSDDASVTPSDNSDQNSTDMVVTDADNDGAVDSIESTSGDRDSDGIMDQNDYDPTGYFYCQSDGRILSGGSITVQNLAGGSQTGVGTSNGITIVQDGSNGFYQFNVHAAGTYRLIPNYPTSGVASTSLTSSGQLVVSSLLPNNPAVIGSGEVGSTGQLADFSPAANRFYTEFVIQEGDPNVFNNNIPLELCGAPELTASKSISSGPIAQANGTNRLTYRIVARNTGLVTINNVSITDDLNAAFGPGNHTLTGLSIENSPAGFTAGTNPFFNGAGNNALLTTGGSLQPGEQVSVLLSLEVDVNDGNYSNTVVVGGQNVLNGSAIPNSSDTSSSLLSRTSSGNWLQASKSTSVSSARIGSVVPYTLTFRNSLAINLNGTQIVDVMPQGFTYAAGSARVNGVTVEPTLNGRELVWSGQNFASGATTTVTLSLIVGASVTGDEFVNSAYIRDPNSNGELSNIAKSAVKLEIEPVFQCSDIIGRVFEDTNRDGYYDDGEPGLAGVRIASVSGLLITTDSFGRYHVTCDQIPNERIGSNYILKLDERTLPSGFALTSENPRVVRITRGKLAKVNFGASGLRKVKLELTGNSFLKGKARLTSDALADVAKILPVLEEEVSVLSIIYRNNQSGSELARIRVKAIKALVDQAWQAKQRPYDLKITSSILR